MSEQNPTLEDFYTKSKSTTAIVHQNNKLELTHTLNVGLSSVLLSSRYLNLDKKAQEFQESLVKHVSAPDTISDISEVVGVPLDTESEDQFVERSLKNIADYLLKKFD